MRQGRAETLNLISQQRRDHFTQLCHLSVNLNLILELMADDRMGGIGPIDIDVVPAIEDKMDTALIKIPDTSNTAAGVDEERKKRFVNSALRSRDKVIGSFKTSSADVAWRRVSEALKV